MRMIKKRMIDVIHFFRHNSGDSEYARQSAHYEYLYRQAVFGRSPNCPFSRHMMSMLTMMSMMLMSMLSGVLHRLGDRTAERAVPVIRIDGSRRPETGEKRPPSSSDTDE